MPERMRLSHQSTKCRAPVTSSVCAACAVHGCWPLTHEEEGGHRLVLGVPSHLRNRGPGSEQLAARDAPPRYRFLPQHNCRLTASLLLSAPRWHDCRTLQALPAHLCGLQKDVVALVTHQHHDAHTRQAAETRRGGWSVRILLAAGCLLAAITVPARPPAHACQLPIHSQALLLLQATLGWPCPSRSPLPLPHLR